MKRTVLLSVTFLLALGSSLWAEVNIAGKWEGTCVSSSSGRTYPAEANFTQLGNDVSGFITIFLTVVQPPIELRGNVDGTVSGNDFTGTWKEKTGDCPDPTAFEYEISMDLNTMTGWLFVDCPDFGEITYEDFVLEREEPITSTTTTLIPTTTITAAPTTTTTVVSNTTTTTSLPCPTEEIYGETSNEAELLRIFRDDILSKTPEGQEIIRLYYEWSPVIVTAIEKDESLKEEIKELVDEILLMIDAR